MGPTKTDSKIKIISGTTGSGPKLQVEAMLEVLKSRLDNKDFIIQY